jgi:hypothetical protein
VKFLGCKIKMETRKIVFGFSAACEPGRIIQNSDSSSRSNSRGSCFESLDMDAADLVDLQNFDLVEIGLAGLP